MLLQDMKKVSLCKQKQAKKEEVYIIFTYKCCISLTEKKNHAKCNF